MDNNIQWKYVKQLTDNNVIRTYESEYGIEFNSDYIEIVKQFNGARPRPNTFDCDCRKECVFKSLLSFNESDKENIFEVSEWLKDRLPKNIIPFASDPAGNYICFDNNNKSDKIVFWIHETNELIQIANSFVELIKGLY